MPSLDTPVILEAAINGMTSKEKNPNAPRSHDEIQREALRCYDSRESPSPFRDAPDAPASALAIARGPRTVRFPNARVTDRMPANGGRNSGVTPDDSGF